MAKGCGKARRGLTRGKIAGAKYMAIGGNPGDMATGGFGTGMSGVAGSVNRNQAAGGGFGAGSNVGGGRQGGANNATSSGARAGQISNPQGTAVRMGELPAQSAAGAGVSPDTANVIGRSLARSGIGSYDSVGRLSTSGTISDAARADMARADDFRAAPQEFETTKPTISLAQTPQKSQDRLVTLDAVGNIVESGPVPTSFGKQFYDRIEPTIESGSVSDLRAPASSWGSGYGIPANPPSRPFSPTPAQSAPQNRPMSPAAPRPNTGLVASSGFMGRENEPRTHEDRTARDGHVSKKKNPYQPGTPEYDQWNKNFNRANEGRVEPTPTLGSTAKSGGFVRRDGIVRRGRTKGQYI